MRSRVLSTLAALVFLAGTAAAAAQTTEQSTETAPSAAQPLVQEGLYIGLHGGGSVAFDSDIDNSRAGLDDLSHKAGFATGGTIGYRWPFRLRTEVEATYRSNKADEIEIGGRDRNANGRVSALSVMLNGFYEFDNRSRWTPYVGGGLGFARVNWDDIEGGGNDLFDETEYLFAAQIGGGVGFLISEDVTLSFDYRALATSEAQFDDETGDDIKLGYASSSLWVGLRFTF